MFNSNTVIIVLVVVVLLLWNNCSKKEQFETTIPQDVIAEYIANFGRLNITIDDRNRLSNLRNLGVAGNRNRNTAVATHNNTIVNITQHLLAMENTYPTIVQFEPQVPRTVSHMMFQRAVRGRQ